MHAIAYKHTQMHLCTHAHDLSVYCSHFYGSPISLLLPFVLRIISLHGMGDFSCLIFSPSHACLQFPPSFLFPFLLFLVSLSFCFVLLFVSVSVLLSSLHSSLRCLKVIRRSCWCRQVVRSPWGSFFVHFFASLSLYFTFLTFSLPFFSLLPLTLSLSRYYSAVWQP